MEKQHFVLRFSVVTAMILLAAISRLVPHMFNFAPMSAMGLFGAAYFTRKWQAFFIPVAATWLSDLYLNNVVYAKYNPEFVWFYHGFYWQYGSYILIVAIGLLLLRKITWQRTLTSALMATVVFFLISNFGVWIGSRTYLQTFNGLIICYTAGVPFLKGTLLGNLFYTTVLFGTLSILQYRIPVLRNARSRRFSV